MIVCRNCKMLEYDSEGIDINKTRASKECDIFLYWYFLNKNFSCEPYLCNSRHDLILKDVILNRAEDYYENNNKELLKEKAKINIENYLKRKKI